MPDAPAILLPEVSLPSQSPADTRAPGANPLWGVGWPRVRAHWPLDPSVAFLNHGSFGACPRPVLERQAELRAEMEAEPVEFLWRRLDGLLAEARQRVAAFLGADPDGLAFVPNATTGVGTVLAGIGLRPGDEVLSTDHAYPAVLNAMRKRCSDAGAELVLRHVPVPLPADEEIVQVVTEGLSPRTRLLVIDHVTSPTAAIFPVALLVAAARERGVPVLVDSAHGPGMVPIDLAALEPDFWTGNFHKWVCAPKGAAGLAVAPGWRASIRPLVTSHGYGGSFVEEFDWTGTFDPTPWLSVPAALDFMETLGWERVRRHNHALAGFGQDVLAKALGTEPQVREDAFGSMSLVALPEGSAHGRDEVLGLQARLFEAARIEVPFVWWNERPFVRLSAHVYNAPAEYERLAAALPQLL